MAFNFLDRLGSLFGGRGTAPEAAPETPAETTAEAPVEAPAADVAADAPAVEAATTEPYSPGVPYTVSEEAAPVAESAAPAPAETYASASAEPMAAAPVVTYSPPIAMPMPTSMSAPEAAAAVEPSPDPLTAAAVESGPLEAAPVEIVAEAPPAEPAKSAEVLEQERLWGEIDGAWASGDFAKVTELLDALKAYQPEDAGAIDEKIAAAQYNQAAALEQSGELDRALYLYQEAQRRNPSLGEAGFAIERVQAALAPPAEAPPEPAPEAEAASAEQTYTVEAGDTLSAIAERFYGDPNQWPRIFDANGDQLDNPDLIQPGQVLRIPA
jgi:hypothetical protein